MLARTPRATEMDFASILKIPPKPAEIADAERDWRAAVAEREAAQAKHRELHRVYFGQVPGQPPMITAAEVDKAGQEIEPYLKREREALELLETHRAAFDAELAALKQPIEAYRIAIGQKLDELEDLLGIGVLFYAASVQANVKLQSKLPGRCQGMIQHGVAMTRKILNGAE
ncbi:hypothetical protein [Mesorhizobium amorphae]|uniref:hypothetical protein n=1 Tax=Mesorhizobium amorphae TaxID=71433 RepID=UPI00177ACDB5|nr:hypothetical protein [Mesorhizobium amorphae]